MIKNVLFVIVICATSGIVLCMTDLKQIQIVPHKIKIPQQEQNFVVVLNTTPEGYEIEAKKSDSPVDMTELEDLNGQLKKKSYELPSRLSADYKYMHIEVTKDPTNGQYCFVSLISTRHNALTFRAPIPRNIHLDEEANYIHLGSKRKFVDTDGILIKVPNKLLPIFNMLQKQKCLDARCLFS